MAYVDLNPVRAAMAKTPEQSDHTSIQHRIRHWQKQSQQQNISNTEPSHSEQSLQPDDLLPFVGHLRQDMPKGVIFNLVDYLQLVDWTGRQIREDKVGLICLLYTSDAADE